MFILEYFRLHLSQYIVAEHRHVGSNNFNLVSSRSHTIFTLVSFFGILFLWDFWNYGLLVYCIYNLNSIYCFVCYIVYLIDLKVYFSNLQKLCACRLLRVALLVKMKMRKKLDYLSWYLFFLLGDMIFCLMHAVVSVNQPFILSNCNLFPPGFLVWQIFQNLIDLAGSESSKTETTGLRRKEGSYINKSLLTLGTVSYCIPLFFLHFNLL